MTNHLIEKLRSFVELRPDDVGALAAITAKPRRLPARRDLIREGDRPGPVFVVLEGWACRYKMLPNGTRQVLAFLMPGDCCDLHVESLAEMDHGIQTITPSLIATIERVELSAILDGHGAIAKAMAIAQRVDEATMRAWITSMGRRTSIERVAHLMCELNMRARAVGLAYGPHCTLPLSQLMLADALGMTPVHLNRVLKSLRLIGAMMFKRGSLLIIDTKRLVQIAGFDGHYLIGADTRRRGEPKLAATVAAA